MTITEGGRDDVPAVAALIADAFHPMPVSTWLVPDPDERRAVMAAQFELIVDQAVGHGHIDLCNDHSGAAVWIDRTRELPPPPDYDARLATICGPHLPRFQALDAALDQRHPSRPHYHLAFLAVAPTHQGNGLGTRLLRHRHDQLDQDQIGVYLEAASPRSALLYHREGYRAVGLSFGPTPNHAAFVPMWRHPRQ